MIIITNKPISSIWRSNEKFVKEPNNLLTRTTLVTADSLKTFLKDYKQCNLVWNGSGRDIQQAATWVRNTFNINVTGYNQIIEPHTIVIEYLDANTMIMYEIIKIQTSEK